MHSSRYNLVFEIEGRDQALVLNPLSRAMDAVPVTEDSLLSVLRGDRSPEDLGREEVAYLLSRGYLFLSSADEDGLLARLVLEDENHTGPVDFLLFPTFLCNFRCPYCFQGQRPSGDALLTFDALDRVFRAIAEIRRCRDADQPPLLYLFGGEPLLQGKRPEALIRRILERARTEGCRVAIITNGWSLSHYADLLVEHGVELVQVTLDGPPRIHDRRRCRPGETGTFERIAQGVTRLLGTGTRAHVRCNLDAENLEAVPELARTALALGWDREDLTLFVGPYRDLLSFRYSHRLPEPVMLSRMLTFHQELPETRIVQLVGWPGVDYVLSFLRDGLLPLPRPSYCIASYGRFAFTPDGKVYACGTAAGDDDHAIGSYAPTLELDPRRSAAWRSRRFTDIPQCASCSVAPICGGGCTLQSRLKHGGSRPFCPEIRGNLEVMLTHCYERILEA